MQSAGPASPKPQHRPGTAGAAPRTTLTVGPAARRRSGAPGLGQGGRGRARRPLAPPASPPALRLVPPPAPSPCSQALGPMWTRRLVQEEEVTRRDHLNRTRFEAERVHRHRCCGLNL